MEDSLFRNLIIFDSSLEKSLAFIFYHCSKFRQRHKYGHTKAFGTRGYPFALNRRATRTRRLECLTKDLSNFQNPRVFQNMKMRFASKFFFSLPNLSNFFYVVNIFVLHENSLLVTKNRHSNLIKREF